MGMDVYGLKPNLKVKIGMILILFWVKKKGMFIIQLKINTMKITLVYILEIMYGTGDLYGIMYVRKYVLLLKKIIQVDIVTAVIR